MEERRDRFNKMIRTKFGPPWILPVRELIHAPRVRDWCTLPYPGHPWGCPNYGKKDKCPPRAPYVTDLLDVTQPMYIVYSAFDLAAHARRMKRLHPEWSDKQARCVLYWQGTSKSQLRQRVIAAKPMLRTDLSILMPEAMGVNVYLTCRRSGLRLEMIKDLKLCRHIAILGWRTR